MDQATAGIPLNHSEQLIGEIPHFYYIVVSLSERRRQRSLLWEAEQSVSVKNKMKTILNGWTSALLYCGL